jgi:hypothetical protein
MPSSVALQFLLMVSPPGIEFVTNITICWIVQVNNVAKAASLTQHPVAITPIFKLCKLITNLTSAEQQLLAPKSGCYGQENDFIANIIYNMCILLSI